MQERTADFTSSIDQDPIRHAYKALIASIKTQALAQMVPHSKKAELLGLTNVQLFAVACYHVAYDVEKQKELLKEVGLGFEDDEMPET